MDENDLLKRMLSAETRETLFRRDDRDSVMAAEDKQIFITCHQQVCLRRDRGRENRIVVWVAADGFRQRGDGDNPAVVRNFCAGPRGFLRLHPRLRQEFFLELIQDVLAGQKSPANERFLVA